MNKENSVEFSITQKGDQEACCEFYINGSFMNTSLIKPESLIAIATILKADKDYFESLGRVSKPYKKDLE